MMKQRYKGHLGWIVLLLLPILMGTGCVAVGQADERSTNEPSTRIAELRALELVVKHLSEGRPPQELEKDQQVGVKENDQIAVEKTGRGLLTFQDRLQVEVFHDTELRLSEARLDPEGFIFVRIKQTFGHTRSELNSMRDARLVLETDYASITPHDSDTEVLVCHAEELTCMTTLQGEVEVEAQGEVVTVKAGESTYILPGERPKPVICANTEELRQWLHRKRGTEEVEPLGALVSSWPQEPCPTLATPDTPTNALLPSPNGMVKIEEGRYEVGRLEADDYHLATQEIEVASFWIDVYEVTNAQYQTFLDETGKPPPVNWPGEPYHPVRGVAWGQAVDYCSWVNKRLPTEVEWEVAGRGPGPAPPLYPWGSDPRADGLTDDLPLIGTYEVGTQAFNKSAFGIYDLAGNVWEWVGEPYGPVSDGYKIVRGGRYGLLRDMAYRQEAEPNDERFVAVAGFRCAADQVEGD